jgi:hypothetical protein
VKEEFKMSVNVFKPTLWAKEIQNVLDTQTGLRKHSDHTYDGEIKGGQILKITSSIRPTVREYVPGTPIVYEGVNGRVQELPINIYRYATQTFDDVDRAQSISGVFENACREMAKELGDEGDRITAAKMKYAIENGVVFDNGDETTTTEYIAQESEAAEPTVANGLSRVDNGLTKLYENNVSQATKIWGEFSPKFYQVIREGLTKDLTDNVTLAKTGSVGEYYNVLVCIENLLPVNNTTKYNILRTGKAVAYAEAVEKTEAGRLESQFADFVRALLVCGCKVVKPKEMYVIKELVANGSI